MTILFDLTAIYDHLTGIERYAMNIAKHIIELHPENDYFLLFKNEIHPVFAEICQQDNVLVKVLPKCHKFIFQQWRLLRCLNKTPADCYIFLSFVSPWFFKRDNIINTIHDISVWDCPSTEKKYMVWYWKIGIRNALKKSKKVVTVSEFSKSRIVNRLHIDMSKVNVVYNGVSDQFLDQAYINDDYIMKVKEKYHLPDQFILCLSTLEPRKNLKLLINAYLNLKRTMNIDISLVLAGRKGWKLEEAVGDEKSILKDIHFTGFIDDEDLPVIYSQARAFVFPSIYEGFGIPVIEAMSCNTVVISSDSSSLPEVIGDAGVLFHNNSVDDLETAIMRVLNMTETEMAALLKKGKERANSFSWQREAEKYIKVIESLSREYLFK